MFESRTEQQRQNIIDFEQRKGAIASALMPLVEREINTLSQKGVIPKNASRLISVEVLLKTKGMNLGKELWVKKVLRTVVQDQLGSVGLRSKQSHDYFFGLLNNEVAEQRYAKTKGQYIIIEDSATAILNRHKISFPNESSIVIYCKAIHYLSKSFSNPLQQMKNK